MVRNSFTFRNAFIAFGSIAIVTFFLDTVSADYADFLPHGLYSPSADFSSRGVFTDLTADGLLYAGWRHAPGGSHDQLFVWEPDGDTNFIEVPNDLRVVSVFGFSADGSTIGGRVRHTPEGSRLSVKEAFRWTEAYGFQLLGRLSTGLTDGSYVTGFSADGSVAIGVADTGDASHAFRWTEETGLVDLGTLGTSNKIYEARSVANDISADGSVIAGYTNVRGMSSPQMATWTEAEGWRVLGSLPGGIRNSAAFVITPDGSTVFGRNQGDGIHAVRWTEESGLDTLPFLSELIPTSVSASSANADFITGVANELGTQNYTPVIWSRAGNSYELMTLDDYIADEGLNMHGWRVRWVTEISNDGKILAGVAYDELGQERAFVASLYPVPEASAAVLLLIAVMSLLGFRQQSI